MVIDDIQVNTINKNKTTINNSQENIYYNKISCRACGDKLRFIKKCLFCEEPLNWIFDYCSATYDSVHSDLLNHL